MSSDPLAGTFGIEHLRLKLRQQVHASAGKSWFVVSNSNSHRHEMVFDVNHKAYPSAALHVRTSAAQNAHDCKSGC